VLFSFSTEKDIHQKIMEGTEDINIESDLLDTYSIWDK